MFMTLFQLILTSFVVSLVADGLHTTRKPMLILRRTLVDMDSYVPGTTARTGRLSSLARDSQGKPHFDFGSTSFSA